VFVIALVGALLSCRQIVNFDDAKREQPDAGDSAIPLLSFVPDRELADACVACAKDDCAAEHGACLADATCRSLLACRGACSDPVCAARCGSFSGIFGMSESAVFERYDGCVASVSCSLECGAGTTWGCLRASSYRWPQRVEEDPVRLQIELQDPRSGTGVPAKLTARTLDGTFAGTAETRGWGQAELVIPGGYDVWIDVESSLGDWAPFRTYLGRIFRTTRLSHYTMPNTLQPPAPRPGTSAIAVRITDCMGSPASGVTFELKGATGESWYSGAGLTVLDGTQTNYFGIGGFADVTPASGLVTVIAWHAGEIVARSRIEVAANRTTAVKLWPLTRDDE
jgi:hypothetical protein